MKTGKPVSPKKLKLDLNPTLEFERGAGFPNFRVVGVDEVGRGCLAGPVVAAAVLLPDSWDLPLSELVKKFPEIAGITDSKAITEKKRDVLAPWIRENVKAFGDWAGYGRRNRRDKYLPCFSSGDESCGRGARCL